MKKSIFLGIFLFLSTLIFGQDFKHGISFAGIWETEINKAGGGFEFGFPLTKSESNFLVRDYFTINGYGWYSKIGEGSIGNKLQFGAKFLNESFLVISYGFFSFSANLLMNESKNFGFSFGGGGGFELQFDEKNSFFVEYGGRGMLTKLEIAQTSSSFCTIGYRQYL